MPAGVEAVAAFLSERDTPCPGCGYNLRGVEAAACPECGRAIELAIARPERWWGGRSLLVLLFAWLLLAGGMNATRAGFAIERAGTVVTVQGAVITLPSLPTPTISLPSPTSDAQQLQAYLDALSVYRVQARPMLPQIQGTRSTAFSWAAVPAERYAAFTGWALLGLVGLGGLVLAVVVLRANRPRVRRAALVMAWLGFAGYFGYHASVFAGEIAARL